MTNLRVAVVGTGRMGAAMAARLRTRGADVVVHNRTRSRAAAVAAATGATVAETAREAAAGADVVLVSLADDAACTEAYGGEDGIVAGLSAATVVADTSTVGPWTSRRLNALVGERDAGMLDAPVSGSVSVVERGELKSWSAVRRTTSTARVRCSTCSPAASSTSDRPGRAPP